MTLRRQLILAPALAFSAMLVALLLILGAVRHTTAPDPGAALRAVPDAPPPNATTDQRIAILQATVRAEPTRPDGYVLLAAAELQKVRENGDSSYYPRVEGLLRRALELDPRNAGAITERGALELSRHDFAAGLRDALLARRLAPQVDLPFGVLVDALVELGRYRGAGDALRQMVARQPNLAAYARVSYWRELHGDLPGAAAAMRRAVSAGGAVPENAAYVQTLLGDLDFAQGRLADARRDYGMALVQLPAYVPAQAGLAKVDAASGRLGEAVRRLRGVVARLPLPQYIVALGDDEIAAGRAVAARRDLALVGAEERLLAANGVNTDVDLALFEANHGSPARAVALARRAWAAAPSVRSADALDWALARSGAPRAALPWARRALALGSQDALFLYHAGMAARAAGDRADARRWLTASLAHNPRFSPLYAPRAQRALEALR
jgi:tetratricopeptide (TPR) repeat protein